MTNPKIVDFEWPDALFVSMAEEIVEQVIRSGLPLEAAMGSVVSRLHQAVDIVLDARDAALVEHGK